MDQHIKEQALRLLSEMNNAAGHGLVQAMSLACEKPDAPEPSMPELYGASSAPNTGNQVSSQRDLLRQLVRRHHSHPKIGYGELD